ncbi:MAG: Asp23/Gls24 family envelope stress response protein [Chloroflexota bacterium]|nr:Asp23/Gls24 family envelope stress response protein [Dehalococcoidia bacterium]MDW8254034.1 Asp23/Gls24 family envelope stress response protein [Chloroflexota bacterium]
MTPPARYPVEGTVRVSPAVIRSVAALTAMQVPGVVAVGKRRSPPRGKPFPAGYHDGVRAEVENETAYVDIDLTVDASANLVEVGRRVQREVASAIETMIGLRAPVVNVRIQDVV